MLPCSGYHVVCMRTFCYNWCAIFTHQSSRVLTPLLAYFQVISAKVVAKARSKTHYRFGYVTMATPEQAQRCIRELNNTELKGKTINVEVVRVVVGIK